MDSVPEASRRVNRNELGRSGGSNPSGLLSHLATFWLRVIPALARYVGTSAPSGLEGVPFSINDFWRRGFRKGF